MPKPSAGEDQKHYLSRCMSDEEMLRQFPDEQQRSAVCYRYWSTERHDMAGAGSPAIAGVGSNTYVPSTEDKKKTPPFDGVK